MDLKDKLRCKYYALISNDVWWKMSVINSRQSLLTQVLRLVREGHWFTLHLVRDATQRNADVHFLCDVLVLVGRSLEHDSDLPMHVCLGEFAVCLPWPATENDLDIVCGSVTGGFRLVSPETILQLLFQPNLGLQVKLDLEHSAWHFRWKLYHTPIK